MFDFISSVLELGIGVCNGYADTQKREVDAVAPNMLDEDATSSEIFNAHFKIFGE